MASWHRPVWLGLLIATSAALTTWFACITPFVAFGVIAATTLARRDALVLVTAAWLANQAVGYFVLTYPWTTDSAAWGLAIGGAALLATLAAQRIAVWRPGARAGTQVLTAFVAAFAVYELALYAVALAVLGGTRAFALPIVGQVLLVNTVTLVGLYGLSQLAAAVGLARASRVARPQPLT